MYHRAPDKDSISDHLNLNSPYHPVIISTLITHTMQRMLENTYSLSKEVKNFQHIYYSSL
uniref:Uncharacterized protein n=1 Tax=Rhizophora mucronata TaxID=61149 RepID=A0A2P2PBQ6_RHIMU